MNFASENFDGAHPQVMKAVIKVNQYMAASYGKDNYTAETIGLFKKLFNHDDLSAYFCFNGTGANNFALSTITEKYHAVYCSDVAHLYRAESTAPEALTCCRLYPVASVNGKILMGEFLQQLKKTNGIHLPVPAVLSITQPTEYGTVYTLAELAEISGYCKQYNLLLHIDGARICNAITSLNCSFAELLNASKADVLTLGGTKMGLLFGEAVLFFNGSRFAHSGFYHKRSMQLASKNRFIAAQFNALFREGLWKKLASHTNGLANYFKQGIEAISPGIVTRPVETNTVFINMPLNTFEILRKAANFYMWDAEQQEARFVFSFSNSHEEIDRFIDQYRQIRI